MALALGMAIRPSNIAVFIAYWTTHTLYLLLGFPDNNTNQTLIFFVGLCVLGGALGVVVKTKASRLSEAALFREFAPALRACLVLLYFWTIWHKLNFEFLNPDLSCGAAITAQLLHKLGLSGDLHMVGIFGVIGTLMIETALPVGLLFARTQRMTALLGMGFHWTLGIAGYSGFSVTMISLLSLFLYPTAARIFSGYDGRGWWNRLALGGGATVLLVATIVGHINPIWVVGLLWYVVPLVALAAYTFNRGDHAEQVPLAAAWQIVAHPRPLLVVPLILFLNGASPYLGFKTEYSYAMYSNLRTEGGKTNHILWRTSLRLAPYQTDLVRVLSGSNPALLSKLGGRPVTRYELTSSVWEMTKAHVHGIELVLEERGSTRVLHNVESLPEIAVEPGFFERTLLKFRRIVPSKTGTCPH
jgi:hypothetical protein